MKPGGRVNRFSVNSDFEMEVRTGRLAGGADLSDGLAARDVLALRHVDRGQVAITGRVAAARVDRNVVAVPAIPLCHDNGSAGRCRDGRPARRRDIEALVE